VASVIGPTKRQFAHPVLVDLSQLKQLDQILTDFGPKLRTELRKLNDDRANEAIKNLVDKGSTLEKARETVSKDGYLSVPYGWTDDEREVTIYLNGGRRLEVTNFTEASEHISVETEIAYAFVILYKIGPFKTKIELETSHWNDKPLSINVSPEDSEVAQSLFGALSNWGRSVSGGFWKQKWANSRFIFLVLAFFVLMFGMVIGPLDRNQRKFNDANLRDQAHELLDHGIDSSNEKDAIRILLAMATEYGSFNATGTTWRYWFWNSATLICLLLLATCPRVTIGLWAGERILTMQRWWMRFLAISIPSFVLVTILRTLLGEFLKHYV
jgi:hypothetical protein